MKKKKLTQVDILPHEQKLLNWCVHDYLVRRGFRISAITFSDECSEQVSTCVCASFHS